jgi:hypothetical protein
MVKNFISAKDARNLTENSDKLLNVAFKTIKESAEYGNNQTQFSVFETDPKVIAKIYNNLTDAGYTVKYEFIEDTDKSLEAQNKIYGLKISW